VFDDKATIYNNIFNVLKSNKIANNYKGNFKFCEVEKVTKNEIKDNGILVGYRDLSKQCFMPLDEFKGDVARIVLYMYIVYKDKLNKSMLENLRSFVDLNLMKSWSDTDKVSAKEMNRNIQILELYKYHNPFVTNPNSVKWIYR
jgi:endonuclease I